MKKPEVKKDRKLTNLEIIRLYSDLKNLKSAPGIKLNYAIVRTTQSLKPLVEAYDQERLIPKSESFQEYESAIKKAYETIASAGTGKPKTRIVQTQQGEYETLDIDLNGDEAKQARAKIQEEFYDAIEERKSDVKEYNEWLEKECEDEYNIHKVSVSEMPQNETTDYKALWDVCAMLLEVDTSDK